MHSSCIPVNPDTAIEHVMNIYCQWQAYAALVILFLECCCSFPFFRESFFTVAFFIQPFDCPFIYNSFFLHRRSHSDGHVSLCLEALNSLYRVITQFLFTLFTKVRAFFSATADLLPATTRPLDTSLTALFSTPIIPRRYSRLVILPLLSTLFLEEEDILPDILTVHSDETPSALNPLTVVMASSLRAVMAFLHRTRQCYTDSGSEWQIGHTSDSSSLCCLFVTIMFV